MASKTISTSGFELQFEVNEKGGVVSANLQGQICNSGVENWEFVALDAVLMTAEGGVISQFSSSIDETVSPGETTDVSAGFYSLDPMLLKDVSQDFRVALAVTCGVRKEIFRDRLEIPKTAYSQLVFGASQRVENIQLISGSIWYTKPDEDKCVSLEGAVSYKNVGSNYVPELKFVVSIIDKNGDCLEELDGISDVPPLKLGSLSRSLYIKEKILKRASAEVVVNESVITANELFEYLGKGKISTPSTGGAWGFPGA